MKIIKQYDEIAEDIIHIYLDYDLHSFPLDLESLCSQLGVSLIPYSKLGDSNKWTLFNKSSEGFFVRGSAENVSAIYYNDYGKTSASIRFTIAHEIKHYVYNDSLDDETSEAMSNFFARYLLCPIPYLIVKNIVTSDSIAIHCGVGSFAAANAEANIRNRIEKYQNRIFDYEIPLLEHLIPEEYKLYKRIYSNS